MCVGSRFLKQSPIKPVYPTWVSSYEVSYENAIEAGDFTFRSLLGTFQRMVMEGAGDCGWVLGRSNSSMISISSVNLIVTANGLLTR